VVSSLRSRLLTPLAGLLLAVSTLGLSAGSAADVPARLTGQEFWQLSNDLSEPDGTFRSDNLLSNEMVFARLLPEVVKSVKPGGVYLGVGPEQNFTYIEAMKARIAFITDIRRNNLHLLLVYKSLFELSSDRAEFLSRLFVKTRPPGLSKSSTIQQLADAYWQAPTGDEAAYAAGLQTIENHLTKTHGIALSAEDLAGVARAYRAFYVYGPRMNYSASLDLTPLGGGNAATYFDLMNQLGDDGQPLSYLGTEAKFAYIKDLESKNLIVPVVGNFSGPKAIRAIGDYLRKRGATVAAFYVSSVEPYLKRAGTFETFCDSVATLPMTESSVFIRTGNLQNLALSSPTVMQTAPNGPRVGTYQTGVVVPLATGCK